MSREDSNLIGIDTSAPLNGSRKRLFGLDAEALAARMVEAGEPDWRGRQLAEAMYRQRIAELSAITTLPKALREKLAAEGWELTSTSAMEAVGFTIAVLFYLRRPLD